MDRRKGIYRDLSDDRRSRRQDQKKKDHRNRPGLPDLSALKVHAKAHSMNGWQDTGEPSVQALVCERGHGVLGGQHGRSS